jgi:antitoxin VapB
MAKSLESKKEVRAKLFLNGRSQAVRLPREFRFEGTEVTVRPMGRGVLLEPVQSREDRVEALRRMFAKIDELMGGDEFPAREPQGEAEERDPIL